ncbi:MAG: pyruvate kinase [Bifidobacteriaceae bacterium]|jgi:pyruvate kinase|nr:pyruvate kinase [Bifidobacteriaceae bacterium]
MRRAKIVCTMGPATSTREQLTDLIKAGMDVARLNMSHGTHKDHAAVYHLIREVAAELGANVGILADLQGPKIRLGTFKGHQPVVLETGARFTITTEHVVGTAQRASTTYAGLPGDARVYDRILIDDGKVVLQVQEVTATDVVTTVEVGGPVSDHKGINLPGVAVSVPALSEKDVADLRFALKLGVDIVALSFVRNAADYRDVATIMAEAGVTVPVVAKIEKPQAVENLPEIVLSFDAIMVARGDLGVELPLEDVPLVQKRAIDLARRYAKPVIVATQVLESMMTNPRPTRAEASDCANAVLDGADAVMLSGETSVGRYPVDAVRTMARIIESTEVHGRERIPALTSMPHTRGGILTRAAAEIADTLDAAYLVAFTETGDSALRMARLRSEIPLIVLTPDKRVRRQLALAWGVCAFDVPHFDHTDQMIHGADAVLEAQGMGRRGDTIVIVSGAPVGQAGTTNQILVHRIGELDTGAEVRRRAALDEEGSAALVPARIGPLVSRQSPNPVYSA